MYFVPSFKYFHITCMNDVIKSRVKLACELLVSGNEPITEIAERCGYHNAILICKPFPFIWETMSSRTELLNLLQME